MKNTEKLNLAANNITIELNNNQSPKIIITGDQLSDRQVTFIKNGKQLVLLQRKISTVFEAIMIAREIAPVTEMSIHLIEGGEKPRYIEQITTAEFDRDYVREVFSNHGIKSEEITTEMVRPLRECISKQLKKSGIYDGTARLRRISPKHPRIIQMKTNQWDCREAVTFNLGDGGFIGFAGWASDKNVNPILLGALEWSFNHNIKLLN